MNKIIVDQESNISTIKEALKYGYEPLEIDYDVEKVKREIFSGETYVFTTKGDIITLPNNSTPIDFAYKIHTKIGNHLSKCFVNGALKRSWYIL